MDDKSKNGMFVLVFLIILISVIGTLIFSGSVDNLLKPSDAQPVQEEGIRSAKVSLTVEKPPVSGTTGCIILNIEKRK